MLWLWFPSHRQKFYFGSSNWFRLPLACQLNCLSVLSAVRGIFAVAATTSIKMCYTAERMKTFFTQMSENGANLIVWVSRKCCWPPKCPCRTSTHIWHHICFDHCSEFNTVTSKHLRTFSIKSRKVHTNENNYITLMHVLKLLHNYYNRFACIWNHLNMYSRIFSTLLGTVFNSMCETNSARVCGYLSPSSRPGCWAAAAPCCVWATVPPTWPTWAGEACWPEDWSPAQGPFSSCQCGRRGCSSRCPEERERVKGSRWRVALIQRARHTGDWDYITQRPMVLQ